MSVIIYILFFGFYFLKNYKKYGLNGSSFLLLIYLASAVTACILLFNYKVYDINQMTYEAAIFHCTCLFLFVSPIVTFFNLGSMKMKLPSERGLKIFSYIILVFCFMSIIYSISKLEVAFSVSDLREARKLHNNRELFEEGGNSGIFSYLASFGHHFSFFAVFLFFLHVTYFPHRKKIIIFLLLASLAIVLNNLSIMGRDGIVRWILFFGFWFFFFKKELSKRLIKRIFTGAFIILIPLLAVFLAITISRFSGRSHDILFYLLDYLGEPVIMFSYNFQQFFDGAFDGRLNFPILFDSSERVPITNLNDTIYSRHNLNTFPTFVGSFYLDFGFLGTFLLALSFKSFSWIYTNLPSRNLTFSRIILFSVFVQIVLLGIFYYMYSSPTTVKAMIFVFLVSVIIQLKYSEIKFKF